MLAILLIEQKQVKAYDEAVKIMRQLREVAEYQGELEKFLARIDQIQQDFPTLRGLHDRMRRAGLF